MSEDQTCDHCGESFTPKRSEAKFCSTKCRVYSKRKRDNPTAGSSYVYCRTCCDWCGDEPSEVRRYVIQRELKTRIWLKANYHVWRDGAWVEVEGEKFWISYRSKIDYRLPNLEPFTSESFNHRVGEFKRELPASWIGTESPNGESFFAMLAAMRPDWSAFGFQLKPSKAEFKKAHRKEALRLHPDHGGEAKQFTIMQAKAERCLACYG